MVSIGTSMVNAHAFVRRFASELRYVGLITIAFAWCAFLIAVRSVWTRNFDYSFLIWNLALAGAPLFFSFALLIQRALAARLFLGACWLLFFPNAPYLITDFMHLRTLVSGPIWLDILMLASCAGTGLVAGYVSLSFIHERLILAERPNLGWILAIVSLFLSGIGIYIGRFLRWRSIDVFANPLSIATDVWERLLHPVTHFRAWGVSLGFATFLILGYLIFRATTMSPLIQNQPKDRDV